MDEQYRLAMLRQSERLAAADRARMARAPGDAASDTGIAARSRLVAMRVRVGRLLIAAGRAIEGPEETVLRRPSPGAVRLR